MAIVGSVVIYLILACIIEFIVERIKNILPEVVLRYITPATWSVVISLVVCFMFSLDLFQLFGLESTWEIPAIVLTAIALSAGSTPLHHLFDKLRNFESEDWTHE